MRCLGKNKRKFYFANYEGNIEIIDENGYRTGEYAPRYGFIDTMYGNISVGQGDTESRQFGSSILYDKVIVLDEPSVNISEFSILWVDTEPTMLNGIPIHDGVSHDYIVKGIHRGLNSVSIAISKVSVNG